MNISEKLNRRWFFLLFFAYVICIGISELLHEPWGDELQVWNLIKGSESLPHLLANARYDGHPAAWYVLLFTFSKFSHALGVIQLLCFLTSCAIVFVFLYYSEFPMLSKGLIVGGYYFTFEYALFSKNYAFAVLIAFLICVVLQREFRFKYLLYYLLLFLLANSHLLALVLAGSFHLFFLCSYRAKKGFVFSLFLHFLLGSLALLSAVYYIFSTPDLAPVNLFKTWNSGALTVAAQIPLRALLPVPAWWNYHFWNTNAVWQITGTNAVLKTVALLISFSVVTLACMVLKKSKRALLFFVGNLLLILALSMLFPLSNARYVGFIYIGFLISLWLNWKELNLSGGPKKIFYALIVLQLPGTIIALPEDWINNFSQINEVKSVLAKVPPGESLITDYWGLNYLAATTDESYYCVENQRKNNFVLLDGKSVAILYNPQRYSKGVKYFLEKQKARSVFFLCVMGPVELSNLDKDFNAQFSVKLISAREGAIEKFSNLYLYRIEARNAP